MLRTPRSSYADDAHLPKGHAMHTLPSPAGIPPEPRPVPDWPQEDWDRIWAASDALQAAELQQIAMQP